MVGWMTAGTTQKTLNFRKSLTEAVSVAAKIEEDTTRKHEFLNGH